MKKHLLLITINFILCFTLHSTAQITGCTDPQSTNYNPAATVNDGSCVYSATNLPLTEKTPLSTPLLDETSGLEFLDGNLWTFNDSGNPNDIYRISPTTNAVLQTVRISNATNIDWEDMTSSDTYLFVGDHGNNAGNRQNLRIYRINKSSLTPTATTVTADIINFSFSDQTSFVANQNNNNFDCESIIFLNDSIHLFSKNWVNKQTRHYVLPNIPGTHVAQYRESFNAGFLVTSASVQNSGVIALVGYDPFGTRPVSLWMIYDYKNNLFFNGNKRKFDLSTELINGQVEGVEFFNSSIGYITNERFTTGANVAPKLKSFDLSPYLPAIFLAPKPDANFTSNSTTICSGSSVSFTDQSTDQPTTWQWLFTGGTPSTSSSQNPQVQYASAGIYSVTLIAGNNSGYDTIVKTNYITSNSLANAVISANGSTSICSGSSVTLNSTTGIGFTYQWRKNTADISGAITSSLAVTAAGDYSCVVSTGCGSSTSNTITINVNGSLSSPTTPSGPAVFCRNTTGKIYSTTAVSGANSYTWSVPSGATIASGQGTTTINVNFNSTAIAGNICVYASSATCGNSATACKAIAIDTAPSSPTSISGITAPCASSTGVVYTCPLVANAVSYTWTAPANSSIVSGQGTNSITLNFTSGFTSGNVKVAAVNCIGNSTTRSLSLQAKPSKPGSISGSSSVCANQIGVAYSVSAVSGATNYDWSVPTGAVITAGQTTRSITVNFGSAGGTVKVRSGNACGYSSYRSKTVSISCREANSITTDPSEFTATIYPNPSTTNYTLAFDSENNSDVLFILRDLAGREIERTTIPVSQDNFTFGSNLSVGIYIAEIISGDERRILRVVKE